MSDETRPGFYEVGQRIRRLVVVSVDADCHNVVLQDPYGNRFNMTFLRLQTYALNGCPQTR